MKIRLNRELKLKIKHIVIPLYFGIGLYWLKFFNSWAILDKMRIATRNQIRRGNAVRVGPQFFDL